MKKDKIYQVISQFASGGAERFLVDLCNEMVEDYEVTVLTYFPIEEFGFFLSELDQRITVISMNKKLGIDPLLSFRVLRILQRDNPKIVHSHLHSIFYLILSMLFFYKRIKFYHTIHNDALAEAPGKFGIFVKTIVFKLKLCTPITISEKSQVSFMKHYGFKATRINNGRKIIISNMTKNNDFLENFKITSQTKIFVNIARIVPEKNQLMLSEVFNDFALKGHDISLLIIGKLWDPKIKEEIIGLHNERIHFLGEIDNPLDYLQSADAFCLSSLYEGMPITLIESFALGIIPYLYTGRWDIGYDRKWSKWLFIFRL